MFRHTAKATAALRHCPICSASAVAELHADEAGGADVRLRVRCGQCDTWRVATHHWCRAQSVEFRLSKLLDADRDAIAGDLAHLGDDPLDPHAFDARQPAPS